MKDYLTTRKLQLLFVFATLSTTLLYAFATSHVWEDFFITFRHSKNLVEGNGLVYQVGERVHGFTSVINTLLPALFYWVTGKSLIATIWLYRLASIAALIFGGWYFLKEVQKQYNNNPVIPLFFTLLFAFQIKAIMYTTNGQEAGFMILFLLPSIVFALNGYKNNWKWAGICWAGLIYTRPDGVVYIAFLSLAAFTFGNTKLSLSSEHREELTAFIKTAVLCALLYLPWFIWAWMYYGSPVPHTITAKSAYGNDLLPNIVRSLQLILSYQPLIGSHISAPTNYQFGGWPYWVAIYSFISWIFSTIYWLIPSNDRLGRLVSFIYTLLVLYFSLLNFRAGVFAWYFPPAEIMSAFILSSALYHLPRRFLKKSLILTYSFGIILLLASTNIYFLTISQITVQQEVIETSHRKQIGLWLRDNKQENDTVFLEPLGYIGYYSNAKMYDYPGLVSPEVVAIEKEKGTNAYPQIINKLKPDWLVLRPKNIGQLLKISWFKTDYTAVKIFSVKKRLEQYKNIVGIGYLQFDSEFVIFKRNKTKR